MEIKTIDFHNREGPSYFKSIKNSARSISFKKPVMTAAEIFSKLSMMSKESISKIDEIMENTVDVIDTLSEHMAELETNSAILPYLYTKQEGETDLEMLRRYAALNCFTEIPAGKVQSFITYIGDKLTCLSNHDGSVFSLSRPTASITAFDGISVVIKSQQLTDASMLDLSDTKRLHASLLVSVLDENEYPIYFINNIICAAVYNTASDFNTFVNNHFYRNFSVARDDTTMIEMMSSEFRGSLPSISNAKAAFNQVYQLGLPEAASVGSRTLFDMVFKTDDELLSEYKNRLSHDTLNHTSFYSLLYDVRSAGDLDQINAYVSDSIAASSDTSTLMSYLSDVQTDDAEVSAYVLKLKEACALGTASVTSTFVSFYEGANVQDSNTGLGFTDSNSLVPKIFLAGIIRTVGTAIAQAVSIIISAIVNYIIPGIGLIAYGVFQGIISIFTGIGKGIDLTTLAGVDPGCSVYGFTYAHDQFSLNKDDLRDLASPLVSNIELWGMSAMILPFAIILMWQDRDDEDTINCETHIRPLNCMLHSNYSDQWGDGILYQLVDGYYYLSANRVERETFFKGSCNWLTENAIDDYLYDISDVEERDRRLRLDYIFSLILYRWHMLLCEQSPTSLMPYNSAGTLLWSDADMADQVESIYKCIYRNDWNNAILSGNNIASWREILGVDTYNPTGLPKLFKPTQWDKIPYGISHGTTSDFATSWFGVVDFADTATDYESTTSILNPISYVFTIPKYDRNSMIIASITTAVALAVITVAIIVTAVKIKQWQRKSAASHVAAAEKAWDDYKNDPSDSNYKAYRTAVRKNNLLSNFNGGTKLAKTNYWGEVDSGDSNNPNGPNIEKSVNLIYNRITGKKI